jgi:hypothetical protein
MKSITIAYHEADESFIMAFFQRMKINALSKPVPLAAMVDDLDAPLTYQERLQGLAASVMEINADIRGEKEMKSLSQLIKEVKEMSHAD